MMKYLIVSLSAVFMIVSFLCFMVGVTANMFAGDVILATFAAVYDGSNPGVGEQIMAIMANGYLTIIEKDVLMLVVIVSAVVFYFSGYAMSAMLRGYPLRSLFTRNYWCQFDFGFAYRPFIPKKSSETQKKPG